MTPSRGPSPEIVVGPSTRRRTKILAKNAPEILLRERQRPPSAKAKARADKVRWLRRVADEVSDGACRDWPWALNNKGYGMVRWEGENARAGHIVLQFAGHPRPDGAIMLHSCDRPACAAPWHLRWGTYAENAADRVERDRGRSPIGTTNGLSKLTDADVLAIRAGSGTLRATAKQYGVHFTVVQKIRAGKIWRHLLTEEIA